MRAYGTNDGALVWTFQTPAGINAPFAIAGDTLLVPSSAFIFASPDTADPLPLVRGRVDRPAARGDGGDAASRRGN